MKKVGSGILLFLGALVILKLGFDYGLEEGHASGLNIFFGMFYACLFCAIYAFIIAIVLVGYPKFKKRQQKKIFSKQK